MKKMSSVIGNTKVGRWSHGVAPDSVEGATLLGHGKCGRLELALYELKNGDFCSVTGVKGMVVRRRDFPQYLADEGCPWEISADQLERINVLAHKIQAENDSCQASFRDYYAKDGIVMLGQPVVETWERYDQTVKAHIKFICVKIGRRELWTALAVYKVKTDSGVEWYTESGIGETADEAYENMRIEFPFCEE